MSEERTGPWRTPDWRVRARAVLADRLSIVVAAFLLLSVAGAGLTYGAVVAPGTTEETRTVGSWSSESDYAHSATVQQENPVYPVGTQLENRSAYFSEASPIWNGTHRAGYSAGAGTVQTQTTLSLVVQAVEESEGTTYWRQQDRLGRETAELAPGETVSVSYSVNVTEIRHRIGDIESSLGTAGETQVLLRAETKYRGTVDGERVNETVVDTASVSPGAEIYGISGAERETEEHPRTIVVEEPVDVSPVRLAAGPLLLLLGLLGAVGGVKADREGILDLTTHEQAGLERAEFEDWVTVGGVPDDPPGERIRVSSLDGLVDLAADTNARIIQDEHLGHYVVFGDEYHYLYEPLGRESL